MRLKTALYLLPMPIIPHEVSLLSEQAITLFRTLHYFIAENPNKLSYLLRTLEVSLKRVVIFSWEEDFNRQVELQREVLQLWRKEEAIGLVAEAGLPAVADPGSELITLAHEQGISVVPVAGASAIPLALCASGFHNNRFQFWGYVPMEQQKRFKFFKKIAHYVLKEGVPQLFIETPYRNHLLLQQLIKHPSLKNLELCIAANLGSLNPLIIRKPVVEWDEGMGVRFKGVPAVFIVGK